MKKKLLVVGSILLVVPVIAAVIIAYAGSREYLGKADVGVVLGTSVYPDRSLSPYLKARLDKTLKLYHEGYFPFVVVSGGTGSEGHDEASVMGEYLIKNGIPQDRIIMDGAGVNTRATARNLKKLMDEKGFESAFVVTQFFHVPRTRMALRCAGVGKIYSSPAGYWNIIDFYSVLREVPAYLLYRMRCFG